MMTAKQMLHHQGLRTYRVFYVGRTAGHTEIVARSESHAKERFELHYRGTGFRPTRVELLA